MSLVVWIVLGPAGSGRARPIQNLNWAKCITPFYETKKRDKIRETRLTRDLFDLADCTSWAGRGELNLDEPVHEFSGNSTGRKFTAIDIITFQSDVFSLIISRAISIAREARV